MSSDCPHLSDIYELLPRLELFQPQGLHQVTRQKPNPHGFICFILKWLAHSVESITHIMDCILCKHVNFAYRKGPLITMYCTSNTSQLAGRCMLLIARVWGSWELLWTFCHQSANRLSLSILYLPSGIDRIILPRVCQCCFHQSTMTCVLVRGDGLYVFVKGLLGGSVIEHLPLAQVVIPGSWDRDPHQAHHSEPASPSACLSASLSVSLMNK